MHVYVLKRSSRLADTVQYDMPYPDVCVCVMRLLHPKSCECAAEQQKHALPKLVGCRVGDGERAACRKGSGCPTLPGPRNEPILS